MSNPIAPVTSLTFSLDGERFAVDVSEVTEVVDRPEITPVPNAPGFMKGLINLRGNLIPVMDARTRFAMSDRTASDDCSLAVMEPLIEGEKTPFGFLVDSVDEVVDLVSDPDPLPPFGPRIDLSFIKSIAHHQEEIITVLNTKTVFHVHTDGP